MEAPIKVKDALKHKNISFNETIKLIFALVTNWI